MSTFCDFCKAPDPEWVYSAPDFTVDLLNDQGESTGAWTACDTCSELIEQDARDALAERSLDSNPAVASLAYLQRVVVKDTVLKMHADFFRSRYGMRRHFG